MRDLGQHILTGANAAANYGITAAAIASVDMEVEEYAEVVADRKALTQPDAPS